MRRLKLLVCLTMLCVSGCGVNGSVIDTACSWVRPIMISKDDALTPGTARQILDHNDSWKAACASKRMPATR